MENHDFYTLRDQKPLNRSRSNLIGVITSGTSPHMQTLVFLSLRGAGLHMRKIVIIRVYFFLPPPLFFYCLAHLHRSHRLTDLRDLWLKRRVFASSTSFLGCEEKFFIFSPIFRKNRENYNGKDRQNIQTGITSFLYKISRQFCV